MNLEQVHEYERELKEELKKLGKLPSIIYPSTWKAIKEYEKILNE